MPVTGVGTVIAFNTDIVRAQIQGQIISINLTEGQHVHAGDLLAHRLAEFGTVPARALFCSVA
jgi:multidrug efflux pump subunit AcrA (membrane-fusion protein)